MRPLSLVLFLVIVSSQAAVSGQTTRTEIIEKQREDKAAKLETYKPGKIEKLLLNAEDGKLKRLIAPYNGFYRRAAATATSPPAPGFALGGGFRHDLFDQARARRVRSRSVLSQLQHGQGRLLPAAAGSRKVGGSALKAFTGRQPQDDYFGPGPDSRERGSRQLPVQRQRVQRARHPHPPAMVQCRHAGRADRSRHRLRDRRPDSLDRRVVRR